MTAYAAAFDVQRAFAAGFQANLAKPVDGQDPVRTIIRLAGTKVE